jgi:hypothetical protein
MELILFRHDVYEQRYNCSPVQVDSVPLAQRRQLVNGLVHLGLYLFCELFAVPCCLALWRHFWENACYKLMFVIALCDMLILHLLTGLTGVLGLTDTVFCQQPTLVYVCGCVLQALWALATTANLVLAVDRCLQFCLPQVSGLDVKVILTSLSLTSMSLALSG